MRIREIWEYLDKAGWLKQGFAVEIPGHDVQIVRYDEDNSSFLVKVDNRMEQLEPEEVIPYIVYHL